MKVFWQVVRGGLLDVLVQVCRAPPSALRHSVYLPAARHRLDLFRALMIVESLDRFDTRAMEHRDSRHSSCTRSCTLRVKARASYASRSHTITRDSSDLTIMTRWVCVCVCVCVCDSMSSVLALRVSTRFASTTRWPASLPRSFASASSPQANGELTSMARTVRRDTRCILAVERRQHAVSYSRSFGACCSRRQEPDGACSSSYLRGDGSPGAPSAVHASTRDPPPSKYVSPLSLIRSLIRSLA